MRGDDWTADVTLVEPLTRTYLGNVRAGGADTPYTRDNDGVWRTVDQEPAGEHQNRVLEFVVERADEGNHQTLAGRWGCDGPEVIRATP